MNNKIRFDVINDFSPCEMQVSGRILKKLDRFYELGYV